MNQSFEHIKHREFNSFNGAINSYVMTTNLITVSLREKLIEKMLLIGFFILFQDLAELLINK